MSRSKSLLVALVGSIALAALLGGWIATGWTDARARARAIEAAPNQRAKEATTKLANELGAKLEAIRSGEDARAYYEYQNLFHDPRGASTGVSVTPSPLADNTADPLVAAHYQIDPKGALSIPPINEELPERNRFSGLGAQLEQLEQLRAARDEIGGELVRESPPRLAANKSSRSRRRRKPATKSPKQTPPTAAASGPPPQQLAQAQQVQRIDPEVFEQNKMSNEVFKRAKGAKGAKGSQRKEAKDATDAPVTSSRKMPVRHRPTATGVEAPPGHKTALASKRVADRPRRKRRPQPVAKKPVEIRIASFAWRTASIGGQKRLVAARTVETPDGTLAQGFVIDPRTTSRWLDERGTAAAFLPDGVSIAADPQVAAPIPGVGGWVVAAATGAQIGVATAEAKRVRERFWWWFIPAASGGLAALGLISWVVFRAERLARERSRFAAAAAHELRTPLAGLQLYGDMLADGLGDLSQSQTYAQRISDEASRLGRVVNNVLGFTQLERGALAIDAQPADIALAITRIIERLRKSLEAAGMTIEVEMPERALARFDEDALARIVGNLLDNAEKYSRDCSERRVRVVCREVPDQVLISVSDGGIGVPDSARERIFRPFARDVDSDGAAGLGLGLALARTLARDQGGDLVCETSADASGACFVLSVPCV